MTDSLGMNERHTGQYLSHVVFYPGYGYRFVLFLSLLDYLFKILVAVLKNDVLNFLSVLLLAVVNVDHLNAVFAVSELLQYFKLP